jgi:hypothetical protein
MIRLVASLVVVAVMFSCAPVHSYRSVSMMAAARSTETQHIPHSGVSFHRPEAWRYYGYQSGASRWILLGFLSTTPFRPPCGTKAERGGEVETCWRPLSRMPPGGALVEISLQIAPFWGVVRKSGRQLVISGHQATVSRSRPRREQLPWYCPLDTSEVMTGLVARDRPSAGFFDDYYAFSAIPHLNAA